MAIFCKNFSVPDDASPPYFTKAIVIMISIYERIMFLNVLRATSHRGYVLMRGLRV